MTPVDSGQWPTTTPDKHRTYGAVWRRHRVIGTLPMLVAVLFSVYYLSTQPPTYTSTATMWVDAPVPSTSTVLVPAPTGPPSATAAAVLKEALASRQFLLGVAAQTPLAAQLKSRDPAAAGAAAQAIAKGVAVDVPGPQLVTITTKERTPQMAITVAKGIATQLSRFVAMQLTQRYQAAAQYDKEAFGSAATALSGAVTQLRQYNDAHPGAAQNPADPTETQLSHNVAEAQTAYSAAQQAYAGAQQQANQKLTAALSATDVSGVPKLLDTPQSAGKAGSKKKMLYGGLGGLLGGAVVTGIVLAILMARDPSVRSESDLEDVLALEVLGTVEDTGRRRLPLRSSS